MSDQKNWICSPITQPTFFLQMKSCRKTYLCDFVNRLWIFKMMFVLGCRCLIVISTYRFITFSLCVSSLWWFFSLFCLFIDAICKMIFQSSLCFFDFLIKDDFGHSVFKFLKANATILVLIHFLEKVLPVLFIHIDLMCRWQRFHHSVAESVFELMIINKTVPIIIDRIKSYLKIL